MFRKMRPLAITTMLVVATIYPLPSTSPRAVWAIGEIDPTTTDTVS